MRYGMGRRRGKGDGRLEGAPVGLFRSAGRETGWKLGLRDGLDLSSHGLGEAKNYDSKPHDSWVARAMKRIPSRRRTTQNIFMGLIDSRGLGGAAELWAGLRKWIEVCT